MSIFRADTRCPQCKQWVTVYIDTNEKPVKKARYQFICTCNRKVEGTDGVFEDSGHMPVGGIPAKLSLD